MVDNVCNYETSCNDGYENIQNNGAYNASCSDNTVPVINSVTKTPSAWTSGSVIIQVTATDNSTMEYSFDNGVNRQVSDSKIFTFNQVANTIQVRDIAGNTASSGYSLTNIDTVKPNITEINQTPNNVILTNNDVVITITANDTGAGLHDTAYSFDNGLNWQNSPSKTFSANASGIIAVRDVVGNVATGSYNITNIDKTPISGYISYSTLLWTNQNVIITLNITKEIQPITGWTKVDTDTYTLTVSENTGGIVNFTDLHGNQGSASFSVLNIDISPPTMDVQHIPIETVYTGVNVTITATDTGGGLATEAYSFDDGATRQADNTIYIITNQTIPIKVRDKAGNISSTTHEVDNIDDSPPEGTVYYQPLVSRRTNGPVVVTIQFNKPIQAINFGWLSTGTNAFYKIYQENETENVLFDG